MVIFWTVVVFYICGHTVEVYGTAGKDALPASLASTVMSTALPTVTPTEDESIKLVDWLTKYGYLPPPDPSTGQLQAWTAVTQAVKKMQKFAGLDDTGVLNEETLQLMQTPRCSLPDDEDQTIQSSALHSEMQSQRTKRAVSAWARRNINWRLRSYPASSKLSRETIRSLVYYALRVWADPTLLEFHEVRGPEGADLQIDFLLGSHGDGYPFDGAGGSVGHAFFPSDPDRAGGVHLDAEEEWAFRQPATEGTDLFTVLVHELGHALGLTHSSVRQSVMRPYYQGPLGDPLHFSLGHHDLQHVTALYGKRGNHIPTDRPLLVTEPELRQRHGGIHRLTHMYRHTHSHFDSSVDRCNTSFDAVAKIRGEIFFFKGQHMWRVSRGGLVSVRAVSVQRLWSALPSSVPPLRAVLERHSDHAIIFISGSQVWLFKDLSLQEGFPQPLSALAPEDSEGCWQGLHWDPTQGVVWGSLREDRERGEMPEESEVWRELIEGGVNGIIMENDDGGDFKGFTFVFKGNSYWKFNHPGSAPEEGYPRPLATDWLDCPQPSSYSPGDISLISDFGRQELREQTGQRTVDQIRHKDKITERDKPHHWECPCQNRAVAHNGPHLLLPVLFLMTMTY
ncbi:matrix metalloproteinase-17b [Myxocyprinus asiaticus]|uniref:matrix metalloproteinase-17b n=1 Tax=Myxocyprinus asiaticus TaxID=70543 RepID=UPI0022223741|nr:matrix metalloproteinase-17b [Myxocyprinus asiaticus]XP_051513695.1 matrix metalloproteinase-17b [Myxocyprinus asiaticus]